MPNPWELDWEEVTDPAIIKREMSAARSKGLYKPKAATSPEDRKELRASSNSAQVERDAQRDYATTRQAVQQYDSGPVKSAVLDMFTYEPDGGAWDKIGGTLGLIPKAIGAGWFSPETLQARDQLNTVSAKTAMAGSQQMKGSSSDKDVALMRTAGVGPYKTTAENMRILSAADRDSQLNQARNLFKSKWIAKFGSMASASPNGMTYEDGLALTERELLKNAGPKRQAPPSTRKPAQAKRVVIDINGNPVNN